VATGLFRLAPGAASDVGHHPHRDTRATDATSARERDTGQRRDAGAANGRPSPAKSQATLASGQRADL